jgi:hypothetical protein
MDMRIDPSASFPRVVIYYSLRMLVFYIVIVLAFTGLFGAIAGGLLNTSQHLGRGLAFLLFCFSGSCLLFLAYDFAHRNPTRPAIVIDQAGLIVSDYVSELIAWDDIEDIIVRTVATPPYKATFGLVEVLLRQTVDPAIRAQINSKKWRNFRQDGIVITITDGLLADTNFEYLSKKIVLYYGQFGTGAPNPFK